MAEQSIVETLFDSKKKKRDTEHKPTVSGFVIFLITPLISSISLTIMVTAIAIVIRFLILRYMIANILFL
jgi:hypothetical protein